MKVDLTMETEALVDLGVKRGPYRSPEEFVARAVELLHEQEEWLAANRTEIAAQIEHGFAQAERGELVDGDEAFEELRVRHERYRSER